MIPLPKQLRAKAIGASLNRSRWIAFFKEDIDERIKHIVADVDELIMELLQVEPLSELVVTDVRIVEGADGKIRSLTFKVEEEDGQ